MDLYILGILILFGVTASAIDVRLVNGSAPNEGRVEIRHTASSDWSTVCGTYWDIIDVIVTCRQLGFQGAHAFLKRSEFGRGTGRISRTLLFCRGGEANLNECSNSSSLVCRNGLTAGAICQEPGYLGCYGDKPHARALADDVYISNNMTVAVCIARCRARGFLYAGLEYGEECYCGAQGSSYSLYGHYQDSACQHPCSGYANERCGGIGRLAVYMTNATVAAGTTSSPPVRNRSTTATTTVSRKHSVFPKAAPTDSTTVSPETHPLTTSSSHVHTEIKNGTKFEAHTSDEMKYLAVVMGSLFIVGVVIISFILVWNFKLRSRMRAIQDSPLNSTDREIHPTYNRADKKAHLLYSDLLTDDVTNNHYESLIASGAGTEEGTGVTAASDMSVETADQNERNSTRYSISQRIPSYFPQPDVYENYRYSYMQ